MSCIHNVWNCYCNVKKDIIDTSCSPLCKYYCSEETSVKNILNELNKGPATNVTCTCAETGYVTLLEYLFNCMYPDDNIGLFGHTSKQAEDRVIEDMMYRGWNDNMLKTAFDKTKIKNPSAYKNYRAKFDNFVNSLNKIPHRNYEEKYPFEFRFVLTLILGYLGKLNTVDIILCHEPKIYFKSQVDHTSVSELRKAVNKTRAYVKESNDIKLAEGMRKFEAWFEELAKENIPPKELTIADVEKQLGYKIKIVGEH